MSKSFSRIASAVLFIVGAAFAMESGRISDSAYGSNVGPNMFPMGLGILLMLLCIRLFYETFRYPQEGKREPEPVYDYKRFFIILGSALLYALLLQKLGYLMTTFLFLTVSFQVMERGRLWKSVLISGVFTFGVYYVFVQVLQGSLPGLPMWFR
jgi:putative tricarboxylic transport membrane protein